MIRRAILALSFAFALAFLWPHAAKANQYAMCTHPGYLAYIDARYGPQTCEIIHTAPITWRGGHTTIRAVRLTAGSPPTNIRQISADIDAAAANIGRAMDRLGGSLALPPITVLFSDYVSPETPRDNLFRKAAYEAATHDIVDGECPVVYYKNIPVTASAYFTFVLAHEVFHCVQYRNWATTMLWSGWVTEASAEYFAYLAQPDFAAEHIEGFDNNIQSTPLDRMDYPAVPFWLWMSDKSGPPSVRDFIPRTTADTPATINPDMLIDFGKAYFDQMIGMPDGTTAMPSTPRIGGTHVVTGSEHIPPATFAPYTLNERIIEFPRNKRYIITHAPLPEDARLVWRKEGGGSWGPPLTEVITCDAAQRYRILFASTKTTKYGGMDIRVDNAAGAGVCTCPLGTWQETPESLKRYFEQPFLGIAGGDRREFIGGGRVLRFNPDHTGSLTYESIETITRTRGDASLWLRQVMTGGTHFTWRVVSDTVLTTNVRGGDNLLTLANEQHYRDGVLNDTRRGAPQSIGHQFRCDATGLHLIQLPFPAGPTPPVRSTLRTDMDFARGG